MSNGTEGSTLNLLIRNKMWLLVFGIFVFDCVSFNQSKSDIWKKQKTTPKMVLAQAQAVAKNILKFDIIKASL